VTREVWSRLQSEGKRRRYGTASTASKRPKGVRSKIDKGPPAVRGLSDNYQLRLLLVKKHFGVKLTAVRIAVLSECTPKTVGEFRSRIKSYLENEESCAWEALSDTLRTAKIIP